jgi:Potential Queuosine, Q, salvage protein family
MFADYRVPQILHHLRILEYPPSLLRMLHAGTYLESGCREELSLRSASIIAVERLRAEILKVKAEEVRAEDGEGEVNSVLIDFYLWDLGKRVESGEEKIEGIETAELVPTHRTRSIWY